jgi:hypothetical protein
MKSATGSTFAKQKDGSVLVSGGKLGEKFEVYSVSATTKMKGITAVRLELLPDPALPAKGPGRAQNGNLVLNEFKLGVAKAGATGADAKPKPVKFATAAADFSQEGFDVKGAIDGNLATGWAVSPQFGVPHRALFRLAAPLGFEEGTALTFTFDQRFQDKTHNIGKFRLSVTTAPEPVLQDALPKPVRDALAIAAEKRTPEQKATVANYYRGLDAELARLQEAVADAPAPFDVRLVGAQDLAWALINNPAFLFNH